jgi:hypothetical protein
MLENRPPRAEPVRGRPHQSFGRVKEEREAVEA